MKKRILTSVALLGVALPARAQAEDWTPLISSTFFDGVRADMVLAAAGILGLSLIIFGVVMLMRTVGR
jgi:hypothetical protein